MGHQSYVLLYTETTLSNHPVVFPKSSCNVHLFRGPWIRTIQKAYDICLTSQHIQLTLHSTFAGWKQTFRKTTSSSSNWTGLWDSQRPHQTGCLWYLQNLQIYQNCVLVYWMLKYKTKQSKTFLTIFDQLSNFVSMFTK